MSYIPSDKQQVSVTLRKALLPLLKNLSSKKQAAPVITDMVEDLVKHGIALTPQGQDTVLALCEFNKDMRENVPKLLKIIEDKRKENEELAAWTYILTSIAKGHVYADALDKSLLDKMFLISGSIVAQSVARQQSAKGI